MRLLLAVNHIEIQRFIAQNYQVEIAGIAENLDELYEFLTYIKADTLIISKYICSEDAKKTLIDNVISQRKDLRVIYLYGEKDNDTENFLRYLEANGIVDYHVGGSINSADLDRLLYKKRKGHAEGSLKSIVRSKDSSMWIKELDSAVITVYSNSSNGKSHLAWNLSSELSERGYITTLINVDRGNSANIYFGIPEIYYDLLEYLIEQGNHRAIIDSCYKKGSLNVITGRLGNETSISTTDFMKILNFTRARSNIVIIDTMTGLNEITLQAISNSNLDFFVFDSDLMHFHMNKLMLERLGNDFIAEKTYAIINNCTPISESYKYVYKQISKMNIRFKGIMPLSSCASLGCDLMHTGRTPYKIANIHNNNFKNDMDNILKVLNTRKVRNG